MHVTLVYIHVEKAHIDDFITATEKNHQASIEEPGNRRFDVLQSADDPARFVLYEAYSTAEDAAAHKQTAHYLEWRDRVAGWMATPRLGELYKGLLPKADA
ncbi:antibiotic biosynthesis monooxygenase [Sulfuriflexus sp.]|uniref:antibiotic biosynthesis monooxygenase n=1 Tax=Sulfuriflexus sp. TaxID=2015443 RepID=UPI0028CCD8C2|nr:antibiotic biosynthesis monooxygenase [Sulfuriflexus sp.]MDT8404302.1 antibiotic biosynthesis monooxygenase [Sulfuriflexus sp.]